MYVAANSNPFFREATQRSMLLVHPNTLSKIGVVQIELLAQDFMVYAVDLRGHGMSFDAKPSTLPSEPVPVNDLLSVVKNLGLEIPLVFGHSLGGLLAALAECRYPATWRAMFLYEPVIPADPSEVCFDPPRCRHMCSA
jgi:pimeloyl-ACP methyl ester carboxylesterase